MTLKTILPAFAVCCVLWACKKDSTITRINAGIVTFSAHRGHIYNIFALDRVHTHSFNAVEGMDIHPWSLRIANTDILGENGTLIMDPNVESSIVIEGATMGGFEFMNAATNQLKTVELQQGAKFSIDFDNAQEASDLMARSRSEQRDTLMALAREALSENFNVSTH